MDILVDGDSVSNDTLDFYDGDFSRDLVLGSLLLMEGCRMEIEYSHPAEDLQIKLEGPGMGGIMMKSAN